MVMKQQRRTNTLAHKARTYKGYKIYPCEQDHNGKYGGNGWHIQTYHHAGQPYDEEHCPHVSTLAEARRAIVELVARDRFIAENMAPPNED